MKRIYIFTLLLFFACGNSSEVKVQQPVKTETSGDLYAKAMEYAVKFEKSGFTNERDYNKAVSGLKNVLSTDQMNPDAWFNMGRLFFYKKELLKAKDAMKNAITYRSNFVEAYSLLTKIYLFEGNTKYALSAAEKSDESVPGNSILMNNLAILYTRAGDLASAKSTAERIIKNNTKFTPAYITLGNVYYLEGKNEMARFIYLKAIDEGDDSGDVYTNLGLVSEKLGEKENALTLLKKAEEKNQGNPYIQNNVAEFYILSGDYDGAIRTLSNVLKTNPKMTEALVNLGIAYTHVKMFNEAEESYNKAMEYDPSFPETYFNYGVFLLDHRANNDKALSLFNKFIALKGKEISDKHRVYTYIGEIEQKKESKR
jgi:tetratricopeptide (TPR) repeat protein